MPEPNDRRAIEAALPSRLFGLLLYNIRSDADNTDEVLDDLIPLLKQDVAEALEGGDIEKRCRRLKRAESICISLLTGRTRAATMLAIVDLVGQLISEGRLVLYEGSPFERTYSELIRAVNRDPANYYLFEAVEKSATKAAHKLRTRLGAEGYYR